MTNTLRKKPFNPPPSRDSSPSLGTTFQRIVIVQLAPPDWSFFESEDSLEELARLVETLAGEVVGQVVQRNRAVHPVYCVGPGKAEAIGALCREREADTVVFDNPLSPLQISSLEHETGAHVMDRAELILEIFARRARTAEAKLQVELAYLDYVHPKMNRNARVRAYRGGLRGFGDSALDKRIRAARAKAAVLRKKIEHLKKRAETRVRRRDGQGTVALIGYTNAGKSSLLNALSGEKVYADDRLFATLDTTTRRVHVEDGRYFLASDTVGFIRGLPHELVASFHSTLAEALSAKLLIHVVDASSSRFRSQMETVDRTLAEMGADETPRLLAFNKIDAVPQKTLEELQTTYPSALLVSAWKGTGLNDLKKAVTLGLEEVAMGDPRPPMERGEPRTAPAPARR